METIRSYSKLIGLRTFQERFDYLALSGLVGASTFGFDRYLNQFFYSSPEWKRVRRLVIIRDQGCDLGIEGLGLNYLAQVHHMNPIRKTDVEDMSQFLLNPEFLITTSRQTHMAIHYGIDKLRPRIGTITRQPGDTTLWKSEKRR